MCALKGTLYMGGWEIKGGGKKGEKEGGEKRKYKHACAWECTHARTGVGKRVYIHT